MTSLVAQAVAEAPFWDRLTVAVVGPLVTAVIGTGLIGLIIVKVTNDTQRKRTEADLRRELLAKVMSAAGTLYYATQSFWRTERTNPESSKAVADSRKELDRRYLETRVQARLLEGELQALLGKELATKWHKVDDLLTVRYMKLTGNDSERLYRANSRHDDQEHSGLTVEQLKNVDTLIAAYHEALQDVAGAVMTAPFQQ
jgi:hypothetical protein